MRRMMTMLPALLVLCPLSGACGPEEGGAAGANPVAAPSAEAWRAGVADVLAAELAFARDARDTTVQAAFERHMADSGLLFRPGPVNATEALAAQAFQPSLALLWTPAWVDAAASGVTGYTFGPWTAGQRAEAPVGGGWYLTIWSRQPDGAWRAVLDAGVNADAFGEVPTVDSTAPGFGASAGPGRPGAPAAPPAPAAPAEGGMPPAAALELSAAETALVSAPDRAAAAREVLAPDAHLLRDGQGMVAAAGAPDDALAGGRGPDVSAGLTTSGDATLGWAWGTFGQAGAWVRIWRHEADGWRLVVDLRSGS